MLKRFLVMLFLLFFALSAASFAQSTDDEFLNAAIKNDMAKVKTLIKQGVNINYCDKEGFTALMFASINGYTELADFLVTQKSIDVNLKNTYGYTALTMAVIFGNTEIVKILKKSGAKE